MIPKLLLQFGNFAKSWNKEQNVIMKLIFMMRNGGYNIIIIMNAKI